MERRYIQLKTNWQLCLVPIVYVNMRYYYQKQIHKRGINAYYSKQYGHLIPSLHYNITGDMIFMNTYDILFKFIYFWEIETVVESFWAVCMHIPNLFSNTIIQSIICVIFIYKCREFLITVTLFFIHLFTGC